MNMSNLYEYFVNQKTVSYIASEYVDSNNIDVKSQENSNKIQMVVKKVLDDTFQLLDKSKISKNNVNDAIEKFVNVAMKRLNLQPRNRNVPAQVNMRMPPQHSSNTRIATDDSLESRTSNYMQKYREFNTSVKPVDVPDWLRSQNTNPKRVAEEQQKKMSPAQMASSTSTRKNTQIFNDSEAFPSNEIEDFNGSSNFSYFNDTPEITSAFDDAFYNTGIDPDTVNDVINDSIDDRLKKVTSARNEIKVAEQKVDNIEELFKNDNEFKKHVNMSNKNFHRTENDVEEQNMNKLSLVSSVSKEKYNPMQPPQQQLQQQLQQQQQMQKYVQDLNTQFTNKEKQYQDQLQMMHGKMVKYEEYLKILMAKYNELKEDRDLLKERFQNPSNANNAIDEKKKELLRLSQELQVKINRLEHLEQLEQNQANDDE